MKTWALCLAVFCISAAEENVVVNTSYGAIKGYKTSSISGTDVNVFKAVPFAAPPVGDLRWKLPQKPAKWTGVRDGTKYSAACMSTPTFTTSPQEWVDEDCLYLNIFAPASCSKDNKCPIMVYHHGGGMTYDSAVYFNDTVLLENFATRGVILIIPAFRLGFTTCFNLGDQELVPDNLGLHDALLGLEFIRDEIGNFGGDADSITVFGHSYGGGMSIMIAFSPLTSQRRITVKKVIALSPSVYFNEAKHNERLSEVFVQRAGCSNTSKKLIIDCMMSKSGAELLEIQRLMEEDAEELDSKFFGGLELTPPIFPFDSIPELLSTSPSIDIISGTTIKESDWGDNSLFPRGHGNAAFYGSNFSNQIECLYKKDVLEGKNNQTHTLGAQGIYLSAYTPAKAVMEHGRKAFLFSFDQPTHNGRTDHLSYIMGVHLFEKDENEQQIATLYPEMFINFTKFGNPSPNWEPMTERNNYYSIAVNLTTGRMPENRDNYEFETVDFWLRRAPQIDNLRYMRSIGKEVNCGDLRSLEVNDESNDETVPHAVIRVESNYFSITLYLMGVFLIGLLCGRIFRGRSDSQDTERVWILGPDSQGNNKDSAPAYAEKIF